MKARARMRTRDIASSFTTYLGLSKDGDFCFGQITSIYRLDLAGGEIRSGGMSYLYHIESLDFYRTYGVAS